jgi:hypothetical protein
LKKAGDKVLKIVRVHGTQMCLDLGPRCFFRLFEGRGRVGRLFAIGRFFDGGMLAPPLTVQTVSFREELRWIWIVNKGLSTFVAK